MKKLTYTQTRVAGGLLILASVVCLANYYLDLGYFGRFGLHALLFATALLLLFSAIAPTAQQMKRERELRRSGKS